MSFFGRHGLGAITGGGAEIFDPEIRDKICRGKESAEEWAEVHRTWHRWEGTAPARCSMGISRTPIIESITCGACENCRMRPVASRASFRSLSSPRAHARSCMESPHATAFEELRNLAISRIFLDNIPHITAYWISLGLPLAQLSLSYGVDDLHGTIIEEKIFHMAGARTPQQQTVEALEKAIREAGRVPMQRNSFYERISNTMPQHAASGGGVSSV